MARGSRPSVRPRVLRHPARPVVAAFAGAILVGSALLSTSAAAAGPGNAPFRTALFTATSAVTVTGMTTVDTATYWTPFGQGVILVLFQIGGLGIVTSASLLFLVVARRVGLRGRLATQVETHAKHLGGGRGLIVFIVGFTLAAEAVIATFLVGRLWIGLDRPFGTALWEGTFHAVASFTDAGFSLYSDSLIGFATDGWFLLPIAAGVIVGGLGFPVWLELRSRPASPSRWSLHTKLTLATTGALLVFGVVAITALEWDNPLTLGAEDPAGRLLGGFFSAVSPRTAGFNAVDYAGMGTDSLLVTDMLMFVGGGSASTAGGIKVTTFAILLLIVWAELRGEREVVGFGRGIPPPVLRQALTVAVISMNAVVLGTLAVIATNDAGLSSALFECVSAFSTVGLSVGLAPALDGVGQAILMALMFLGRVGPLTLGVALVLRDRERLFAHPEERPLVG
jgi:trk system potassium uptake protein TrkH